MISNRFVLATIIFILIAIGTGCKPAPPAEETIMVAPLTTFNWPMYIAKEAGYYEQNGLKIKLVFANHPADIAMLTSGEAQVTLTTLEQAMRISPKDDQVMMLGSPLKKWLFALVAGRNIKSKADLRGKRVGVTQLGSSTYDYAVRLLNQLGIQSNQMQWVSLGASARAAALQSGHIDATMLSAPTYFPLERDGFNVIANLTDYENIHTANVLLFKKSTLKAKPLMAESIIKAHAEAVKRFYADKQFAIRSYLIYDKQDPHDLGQVYEIYCRARAFDRVPYILSESVQYVIDTAPDARLAAEMKAFDYHAVIENETVDRLAGNGFFERLFGREARAETDRYSALAFR